VTTHPLTAPDLEEFLGSQADLGTKAWPRFVKVLDELPRTATNKVLKRELQAGPLEPTWTREERGRSYA
jgi:fatty-acyl-CoA synthase